MANKRRDEAKERFWREALGRHEGSGLGVRAFCRRERLAESAFYFWRRTLARRDAVVQPRRPAPAFVPMAVTGEPRREEPIRIELAGGRVLQLPATVAAPWLAEFVQQLERQAAR